MKSSTAINRLRPPCPHPLRPSHPSLPVIATVTNWTIHMDTHTLALESPKGWPSSDLRLLPLVLAANQRGLGPDITLGMN